MLFNWLDTKEAALKGVKLAENLSTELNKKNNKNIKKEMDSQARALQNTFILADQFKRKSSPNFYQKSKLANEFKWRLLELGHDKDLVDALTKELVLRMR
jgi:poly(A) polymerase Pap1